MTACIKNGHINVFETCLPVHRWLIGFVILTIGLTGPVLAHGPDSLKLPQELSKSIPQLVPAVNQQRSVQWTLELGGLASSSGSTPYWLQTNQYGTIPKSTPAVLSRVVSRLDYRDNVEKNRRKTDWGYGVELVGQGGQLNQVIIAEAYLKARLGVFELFAGRRRQVVGLAESPLSSGSYIWSGNALPLPQIQLSIPDYAPLPIARGFFALKGFFAHGWFGAGPYVQQSYLHQKAIYLRLGRPKATVRLYGAFTHQVQWGGYAPFLESDPTSSFGGQIAQSLGAFMNVVVPVKTDALKDLSRFTTFDQNRVGDHRGSAEVAIEIKLAHSSLFAYQQHFYDVGRKLYNFRNIEDGLYGLRYQSNKPHAAIKEIVLELFNSGNQGIIQFGTYLGAEAENYFLNGQYPESWSYRGRTIGTPFISQASDVNSALPRIPFYGYTMDNQRIEGVHGINNNRVWALHAGMSGYLGRQWSFQAKASYSKNYGTFTAPFPPETNQLSTLASLTKSTKWFKGATMIISMAYDQGQLLASPQQYGGYLGLRKMWGSHS